LKEHSRVETKYNLALKTQARWFCIIHKTNDNLLGHMDLLTMGIEICNPKCEIHGIKVKIFNT
jgi:hypothetical protein